MAMDVRSLLATLMPLLLVTLVACAGPQPTPAPTPADSPEPANGDTIGRTVSCGIVFEYAGVDGDRRVAPIWTSDCRADQLSPDDPLRTELNESGAVDSDFARDFLDGPDVRLPAGEWQVTAMIDFFEGEGCSGAQHSLRAAVQITVE
jgi:hypothetical protein